MLYMDQDLVKSSSEECQLDITQICLFRVTKILPLSEGKETQLTFLSLVSLNA